MKTRLSLLAAAAVLCAAGSAHADILTYTGDTTNGPTYDRPFDDFTGLSGFGAGVSYSTFTFTVAAAGSYTFLTTGAFDTFVFLYSSFDPSQPLNNGIAGNDDLLPGFTTSGFATTLAAGTYTYVVTGFDNTEFGAFSTTIGGPGVIAAVPEPAAYAMFALGLAVIGARRFQSRKA
jgi:hypothetical protein